MVSWEKMSDADEEYCEKFLARMSVLDGEAAESASDSESGPSSGDESDEEADGVNRPKPAARVSLAGVAAPQTLGPSNE